MPSAPSVFANIPLAPADPIFKLTSGFNEDTSANKINVGVGAYRGEDGKPWVLPVVKKAEKLVVENMAFNHEYLPIDGYRVFTDAAARLSLGADSPAIADKRYAAIQGISGTGCLRIGADFLKKYMPKAKVYIPNPTWIVHKTLFTNVGFHVEEYPYWNPATKGLDLDGMLSCLKEAPEGSIIILHSCAHNPTGVDPTQEQWHEIANVVMSKKIFPFFDSAYQGFASGDLDRDAYSIRHFVQRGINMFISMSFSKNFGLYNERTGCLVAVCSSTEEADRVRSQLKIIIRPMISNPPAFGARIVATILNDPELFKEWVEQLRVMSSRIKEMRSSLHQELKNLGTPGEWSHIVNQIGMFSFTGLNAKQSTSLRDDYHIYLPNSGRVSMAGINSNNLKYFAQSMDKVVRANL